MATPLLTRSIAIIGGGISGLTAAYYAIEQGSDPYAIRIYEEDSRLGGRIRSGRLGGQTVNLGAEFVYGDHHQLIALCRAFDLPLIEATDQNHPRYHYADGTVPETHDFLKALQPLQALIHADRTAIEKDCTGALASVFDAMSMKDYLREVNQRAKMQGQEDFFEVIQVVEGVFAAECGRPVSEISAFRFINEFAEKDAVLAGDYGFRIEGGTERLIQRLREYLSANGVAFHIGYKLERLRQSDEGTILHFTNSRIVHTDHIILAVPAYALSSIQGLESIGLPDDLLRTMEELPYTDNLLKCTVQLKPDVRIDRSCTFSAHGFQAWMPTEHSVTFLVHHEKEENPDDIIRRVTELYAESTGGSADDLFEPRDCEHVTYAAPEKGKHCWAAPGLHHYPALKTLGARIEAAMENQPIAFTGTYSVSE